MSLAEIQGTPLGTKMGVSPPVTATKSIPILTKTGVKTTVLSPQPKGVVGEVAKQAIGDTIGGALENALRGIVIPTKGYNVTSGPPGSLGLLMVKASGQTGQPTVVEPKTSTTVNISQNPLMGVVKAVAEQNLGNWYMQNPAVQKMLAVARTGATVSALTKAGYGNIYLPGSSVPLSQEVAPVIYNKELGDVSKIAQQRWSESQNLLQPLQKGTVEGIVAKEYLQNTTTIYERIIERFYEYINQGGGGTPEAPKGTDWGLIAIIGIVAIAGVLLLGSFIKRS